MAQVNKIDSNATNLRYSEETSIGVADVSAVWRPLEPNSYADFGQELTLVPREPITDTRQRKKGVATDIDASGGFSTDLTQENLVDILQGFFFATIRDKDEITAITVVDGTGNDFEPAAGGDDYVADDLLFASGFDDAVNNGLHLVSGVPAATTIPVTTSLVTAAAQDGTVRRCGFEFATADADIDATGTLPTLTTSVKDMTDFDIIPGEWVFIGGDLAANQFVTAANNGFKRVLSVTANVMTFDKSDTTMITETGTGLDIRIFFPTRVLKNETGTSIVRRTYQLERTLGAPDDTLPAEIQAEYVVGAVPATLTFNISTADKLTVDLAFVGVDEETIDGPSSLKAGTRPSLVEADAFNTSGDFSRIKMNIVDTADENPTALFAFIQELTISVDNNVSINKAVGTFGGFDATAGKFAVAGSLSAYFGNTSTIDSIRANNDVTIDMHLVRNNQGISIDIPLVALGDGRLTVEADSPILQPITFEAADGTKVESTQDHTLLMGFWDFLPSLADT